MANKDLDKAVPDDLDAEFENPFSDQEEQEGPLEYPLQYLVGRPSRYQPAFCEKIVQWGREGQSCAYMAAQLGIGKMTFYEWIKRWPQFARAYEIAKSCSQDYYEQLARSHMIETPGGNKLNTGLYKMHMAAHYKDDYSSTDINVYTQDKDHAVTPQTIVDTIAALEDKIRGTRSEQTQT